MPAPGKPALKADREYDRLLNLSAAASKLYPYEECQMMKLDCLIALKRYQEAMEVYKQVVVQYFEEQGFRLLKPCCSVSA